MSPSPEDVVSQLERSKRLGFLGDGPVADHVSHAQGLLSAARRGGGGTVVDLGSGGGLPGLLALLDPIWERVVLMDRSKRRCAFLRTCVAELGVADRVTVAVGEAEWLGRSTEYRNRADAVVARSFGPPSATLECAAPLVRLGGCIVVADPPGGRQWPPERLRLLGLTLSPMRPSLESGLGPPDDEVGETAIRMSVFEKTSETDDQFPRRQGVPVKKPLW